VITTEQTQTNASIPGVRFNAEAAVDAINKAGGIHRRKIELEICDDHFTSAGSLACCQQFSADK
jgi:ABC-type branched-subunit amino acid transport system substrate-binding protein